MRLESTLCRKCIHALFFFRVWNTVSIPGFPQELWWLISNANCTSQILDHLEKIIKLFIGESARWSRVQAAASCHLSKSNSKYITMCHNLPDVPSESFGYHYACLCKFTSVPAQQSETPSTAEPGTFSRSQSSFHFETFGILPELFIFCRKKTLKVKQQKVHLVNCGYDRA